MTQVLQLLLVVAVGVGLACYGMLKDREEHKDSRQRDLPFPPKPVPEHERELVIR
jgi:hypothetical protein